MTLISEAQALIPRLSKTSKARLLLERIVPQLINDSLDLALADALAGPKGGEWPITYRDKFRGCAWCDGLMPGQAGLDQVAEQVGHAASCPMAAFKAARGLA
jgi:hypothetical protein